MQTPIEIHTATRDARPAVVLKVGDAVTILAPADALDIGAALITAAKAHPAPQTIDQDAQP